MTPTDKVRAALDDAYHISPIAADRRKFTEALSELSGMVLVPVEPTRGFPSMAQAGAAEMWDQTKDGLVGHDQASAVYRAMIAPYVKGGTE